MTTIMNRPPVKPPGDRPANDPRGPAPFGEPRRGRTTQRPKKQASPETTWVSGLAVTRSQLRSATGFPDFNAATVVKPWRANRPTDGWEPITRDRDEDHHSHRVRSKKGRPGEIHAGAPYKL